MIKLWAFRLRNILAVIGCFLIVGSIVSIGLRLLWSSLSIPKQSHSGHTYSASFDTDIQVWVCETCAPGPYLVRDHLKVTITFTPRASTYQSIPLFVSIADTPASDPIDHSQMQQVSDLPTVDEFAQFETQLSGSSFDIDPRQQLPQDLFGSGEVRFNWTITPKYDGNQTLVITLLSSNERMQTGLQTLATRVIYMAVSDSKITKASDPIAVNNITSFFSLGQVTLAELLVLLLGSVLNVPWIVERFQKKKERVQRPQSVSTQNISKPSLPVSATQSPSKGRRKRRKK